MRKWTVAFTTGIDVEGGSFVTISGNTIRNHGINGIAVNDGSVAHIGGSEEAAGNLIRDNTQSGIGLGGNSEAIIQRNTIRENGDHQGYAARSASCP